MSKVVVSTKGHLIDPYCKYSSSGKILESNDLIYDCTLNQTNIKSNTNKFYIMQIIITDQYVVYIRYGRIGVVGKITYKFFNDEQSAIKFFVRQFKTKTGNKCGANFIMISGKYHMADIQCANISSESDESDNDNCNDNQGQIDDRVIDFLKVISNKKYMKNTLIELEIDIEKIPLGKMSQKQIDKAYKILDEITKNVDNEQELIRLSSEFYTLIPIVCGMKKPPIISSKKLIGKNLNLLNELSQMIYGSKIVTKFGKNNDDLLNLYNNLSTDILPMDKTDGMYKTLKKYIINSKAPTHNFDFKILNMYEINRHGERQKYDDYSEKINNRMLLFHGTRTSNLIGILKNGLVCDPSKLGININISGKMFGLGVYFANAVSKSIQYCAYDSSENIACIFICEIALGKMLEKTKADSSLTAKTLPKPYNSTFGMGQSSYEKYDSYNGSTKIPCERIKKLKNVSDRTLLYDEFIVYNEHQINIKYVVMLKISN